MTKILLVGLVILSGCTTPRVWLSKNDGSTGVVSYENYDPKSDRGKRFNDVIPCASYQVTANPIYRLNNGNQGYYVSNNLAVPLGDGYTERGELHYSCVGSSETESTPSPLNSCYEQCNRDQRSGSLKVSLMDCYQKLCK